MTERVWEAIIFVNQYWKQYEKERGIEFPLPTKDPTNRLERALQQRKGDAIYFYYVPPEKLYEYWKKLLTDIEGNTNSTE